jgi:hypothetical protein
MLWGGGRRAGQAARAPAAAPGPWCGVQARAWGSELRPPPPRPAPPPPRSGGAPQGLLFSTTDNSCSKSTKVCESCLQAHDRYFSRCGGGGGGCLRGGLGIYQARAGGAVAAPPS